MPGVGRVGEILGNEHSQLVRPTADNHGEYKRLTLSSVLGASVPIAFRCPCDQDLEVDDQVRRQTVSCPTCQTVVVAPAKPRRAVTRVIAAPAPGRAGRHNDSAPTTMTIAGNRSGRTAATAAAKAGEPRRRADRVHRIKKKKRKPAEESRSGSSGGVINGGVRWRGLIAMLIAVDRWFVRGRMRPGWVFFYPPILFIIGLVGVVKGLVMGGDD